MTARVCVAIPRFAGRGDTISFELAAFLYSIADAFDVQAGHERWGGDGVTLEPAPHPPDCVDGRAELFDRVLRAGDRYTHLLAIDADTGGPPDKLAAGIRGMLRAEVDWIACPVVLKSYDWEAVRRAASVSMTAEALEAASHVYSPDLHELDLSRAVDNVLAVDRTHLAFTLLRREVLVRMTERYGDELRYWRSGPKTGPGLVALPMLGILPSGELVREDYAVADRWREMGGGLYLYLGAGAMDHVGLHCFRGASSPALLPSRTR
jgi:hypothetical protein